MTLSRDSRIVRWAYLLERDAIPERTSLCPLFWRCVLISPVKVVFPTLWIVSVAVFLWHISWASLLALLKTIGVGLLIIVAALVIFGLAAWACFTVEDRVHLVDRATGSVLWQGAKAVKSRFCPLVTIR